MDNTQHSRISRRAVLGGAVAALEFATAVKAAGQPGTLLVGEDYNHFEIQETLGNPYGLLGRAALAQMRLNRA